MRPPIRIVLPDAEKQVSIRFYPDERRVEVEPDEEHFVDVMFDADGHLVASSGYPHEQKIGHDPVYELAQLAAISRPLAELVITQFLELSASR